MNFEMLRWTGTLHRIAIVFLCCGMLFLHTSWRTQALTGTAILLLYYAALVFVPTPGYGRVMLEPGLNIAHWVDQHFLPGRMWQGNWDPEGILANISSVVSGITGMLAGAYLLSSDSWERKVIHLFLAGGMAIIAGIMWGWGSILGVNTNLWSPAYVLISSGFAASALAACIYVIDILGKNKNHVVNFGVIYGMNAIAVYVLADLLDPIFYGMELGGLQLNQWFVHFMTEILFFAPKFASMCYAILYVFVCFVPAYFLYRKKIFIKL
jgi:predicted acyltransferase